MLVRKYGGSSVSTAEQIEFIIDTLPDYPIILVLSAPKGKTSTLYHQSRFYAEGCTRNQYIASGEIESCLLFHMALQQRGLISKICTYDKIGIIASQQHGGYIHDCQPSYIQQLLKQGVIAIVPGFHAMYNNEIALLKRGGSDDTAVALAIALNFRCEIYSDVGYIHGNDSSAYAEINYDTMYDLIGEDEAPMSRSAVLMAKIHKMPILFNRWDQEGHGTLIGENNKIYEANS